MKILKHTVIFHYLVKPIAILFFVILFFPTFVIGQSKRITKSEYVKKYSNIAVSEMKRTGIPASITLSQAILESDIGNSTLAKNANNHFGIKCHSSWKGKKVYHDDDKKHECFRKYKTVEKSFIDHSDFLKNGRRYQFLFELKTTNYKSWAKGLRKAGYATNPKYPKLLINIIEDLHLSDYDKGKKPNNNNSKKGKVRNEKKKNKRRKNKSLGDVDNFSISIKNIKQNNRVKYITVKNGDTYYKISKKYELMLWEILRYNDLKKESKLVAGQRIYIQPKRNKAEKGKEYHIVKNGDTMYTISQKYAVKLKKLYRKNNIKPGTKINVSSKIYLRRHK